MIRAFLMPNPYYYFESGEVSYERLLLEIELLKRLKCTDLLHHLNWKFYDTTALKIFLQVGIDEVIPELTRRFRHDSNEFEQLNFIYQCIQKYQVDPIKENFKHKQPTSLILILDTIMIFICLFFVIGLSIYEFIQFDSRHHLLKSLDHPLTARRRHLSITDDLSVILLTFASSLLVGFIIFATRFSQKIILFGTITLFVIIILLVQKNYQLIIFLSTYRELRWAKLYDYLYS